MCACTARARPPVSDGECKRSNPASVRGASDVFLTLPTINHKLPWRAKENRNQRRWADLALLTLQLVDEKDIKMKEKFDPRDVIDQALSQWAEKHCGDLMILTPFGFGVSLPEDEDEYSMGSDYAEERQWRLTLTSENSGVNVVQIQSKVESLESIHPGLGWAAVSVANMASIHTIASFDPGLARSRAEVLWWYGTDNDVDFLGEYQSYNGEEEEDSSGNELFKPSDFDASLSSYFDAHPELDEQQISNLAELDGEAGEVARLIVEMMSLIAEGARLPDLGGCEYEQVYFSSVVRWNDDDAMLRVHDDFINDANMCGDCYTDVFGTTVVPFDVDGFQQWADITGKGLLLYSKLDRLMQLIGTVQTF